MIDQERTQSLFRKLEELLSHKGKPTPERVHHVRTTARRLEAVLQVCYPEPGSRVTRLMRQLKKLRRRAGRVRDIDVQTAALRGLKIGRESERKSRLLAHLADTRDSEEDKFRKAVQGALSKKVAKHLDQVADELAQSMAPPKPGEPVQAPVWLGFEPVLASLRMFVRATRESKVLTPENLHGYRTRCKRIRYIAEMAGDTPETKRVAGALKKLQDGIGDWHDWVTLTNTAEELFKRSLDSALVAALRNITSAKFVEARNLAEDIRRELMREYRETLAADREKRQRLAGGGKSAATSRRKPASSVSMRDARAEVA
ncbi:MAG: CHAD domain-containing protein [Terriglobales bacterium]